MCKPSAFVQLHAYSPPLLALPLDKRTIAGEPCCVERAARALAEVRAVCVDTLGRRLTLVRPSFAFIDV